MPVLGLGVYQIPPGAQTEQAVHAALEVGYRLIDTAALYNNEASVGNALNSSGIPRSHIFVTTKIHPLRFIAIEKALHASLRQLRLDYVDLYLIHWPFLRTRTLWQTLEALHRAGHARAIGVSNFRVADLNALSGTVPAVNQVEFHPFLYRKTLLAFCRAHGVVLEAHSPLTHGKRLGHAPLRLIADRYGRSPAQILIRWSLQHGVVVIPGTASKARLVENATVFDFELADADMFKLDALNEDYHVAALSRIIGDPA